MIKYTFQFVRLNDHTLLPFLDVPLIRGYTKQVIEELHSSVTLDINFSNELGTDLLQRLQPPSDFQTC